MRPPILPAGDQARRQAIPVLPGRSGKVQSRQPGPAVHTGCLEWRRILENKKSHPEGRS